MLGPANDRVRFLGPVEPDRLHEVFRQVDIVALPESLGKFSKRLSGGDGCGARVIGSSAGGMAEQLDGGEAGLLIPPENPRAIADAPAVLAAPQRRQEFGRKARARVLSEYAPDRIGKLMEQSYEEAIRRRKAGGIRWRTA